MLSVLQGVTQSLNDQLSEVWRHERTGWVPGLARLDSQVGRGQVRKDLGDYGARGLDVDVISVCKRPGGKGSVRI